MSEYFVITTSFAAPLFSDTDSQYVKAGSAEDALKKVAKTYSHPCGLYAAVCYSSADAYHKNEKPLAKWLCNHEREKMRLTANLGSYGYLGDGPGRFRINDTWHTVRNPRGGSVVTDKSPAADGGKE